MAIDNYLASIRSASYGADVRDAIANALAECYSLAVANANNAYVAGVKTELNTIVDRLSNQVTALQNSLNGYAENRLTELNRVIAAPFNRSSPYSEGQYVTFDNLVYRAKHNISSGTAFSTDNWQLTTVSDEILEVVDDTNTLLSQIGDTNTLLSQIGDEVSELKSALTNTRDAIDIAEPAYTLTANKAMTTQTTSLVDSQMFSIVDPIAISKGETIEVTCSTFATTFGIIATCNSDNTSRTIIVTSDGNDGTRYEYTATADGYVCLLIRNGEAPDIILYKKISQQIENLESEKTNLQSKLSYNENFIKGLANYDNIELTIHKGSFYTNNVVYTEISNQDFQTAEITGIDPFHYYHISASSAYGNTVYAFLDFGGNVLEKVLDTTGSGTGTDFDGNVKAPANASILRVGTCRGDGTLYVGEANGVEPHDASVLYGVRWAVFGDSLTEVNSTAKKKYYDWIAERTGIIPVNYGSSGTGYYSSYDDDKAFFQRMASIDPDDFDFMTIFGSGNDIKFLKQNTLPLGTCDDYGNLSAMPTTMGAAINRTIEQYYALSPVKPLALITPTPWSAYCTGWRMDRDDALYMQDYSDLIVQIAKIRGIPCLNLFNESGFRPWSNDFRIEYYNENGVQDGGVHPNSKGHKLLSYQFEQFIKKVF